MENIKKDATNKVHLEILQNMMFYSHIINRREPFQSLPSQELSLEGLSRIRGATLLEGVLYFRDDRYSLRCTEEVLTVELLDAAWKPPPTSYLQFDFESDGKFSLKKVTPEAIAFMTNGKALEIMKRFVAPIVIVVQVTGICAGDLLASEPALRELYQEEAAKIFVSLVKAAYPFD